MTSPAGATSALTAYRPAFLVAAGLATAYGTYLCFQILTAGTETDAALTTNSRSTHLQRSNAVRRTAPRGTGVNISLMEWPMTSFTYNDEVFTYNVRDGLPPMDEIVARFGLQPHEIPDVRDQMGAACLDDIFLHIHRSGGDPVEHASFRQSLGTREYEAISAFRSYFTDGQWWSFTNPAFELAVRTWIESDHTYAETLDTASNDADDSSPSQGLRELLYHIAAEEAQKKAYVHRGTTCDSCSKTPITGIRWHCINCPDFDLCSTCETSDEHPRHHIFAKIQVPLCTLIRPPGSTMQPFWYPGGANKPQSILSRERTELAQRYGFEEPQIDAYLDQFHCLCLEQEGPAGGQKHFAIDPLTFYKAFVNDDSFNPTAPNYVYDRMFAFYDTNNDGFIDFEEFLSGMAYLMHPSERKSLERVFNGYDRDADGLISRADMVRMFRAKYAMHKKIMLDFVLLADSVAMGAGEVGRALRTNQPISSTFTTDEVPRGQERNPVNKPTDEFGDAQVLPHALFGQPILPNGQTDMDVSFWEAVFARHGRPDRLAELHPDFNDRLDARLEVRDRYTGTESLQLDGEGEGYLLRADSRNSRPFSSTASSLRREWAQDLSPMRNGVAEEKDVTRVAERDRAITVSRQERDLSLDLLQQTIDDGLNELFDKFFSEKEQLARRVKETQEERSRHRTAISAFMNDRVSKGAANDVKHDGEDGNNDTGAASPRTTSTDAEWSTTTDEQDSSSPLPAPETRASPVNANAGLLGQSELMDRLQETAVPTDDGSLSQMEESIRQQDLDALLASAGYGISDNATFGAIREDSSEDARLGATREAQQQEADALMQIPTSTSGTVDLVPIYQRSGSATPPRKEAVRDLPWTPESVGPTAHGDSAQDTDNDAAVDSTLPQDMNTDRDSESEIHPKASSSSSEVPPPSASELKEWYSLEQHAKEMIERGGPARISLEEFEEIIRQDQSEGGRLKSVVESWLEYAAF